MKLNSSLRSWESETISSENDQGECIFIGYYYDDEKHFRGNKSCEFQNLELENWVNFNFPWENDKLMILSFLLWLTTDIIWFRVNITCNENTMFTIVRENWIHEIIPEFCVYLKHHCQFCDNWVGLFSWEWWIHFPIISLFIQTTE